MVSDRTLLLEEILLGNLPRKKRLHSVCTYLKLGAGRRGQTKTSMSGVRTGPDADREGESESVMGSGMP